MDISRLSRVIANELANYSEEVTEITKQAVDKTAKEVNDTIKRHITFEKRTGKYVKSFKLKKTHEDRFNKTQTWYVANGQHRLTHLLEKGHANRDGSRTQSFPHIKYGEELAQEMLPRLVEEGVRNL